MTSTWPKASQEKGKLPFILQLRAHIPSLRETREGPKSRNLEGRTEAAIPEEIFLLDQSIDPQALISLPSYTTQDRLPRDSTAYSGLAPPAVIINQENTFQTSVQADLGRQFLYWGSLSPGPLNCILSWQWEKWLIRLLPLPSWFQCTLLLKVSVAFLFIYLIYLQLICESFLYPQHPIRCLVCGYATGLNQLTHPFLLRLFIYIFSGNSQRFVYFTLHIWLFYLHACTCTTCVPGAGGGQKKGSNSLELE